MLKIDWSYFFCTHVIFGVCTTRTKDYRTGKWKHKLRWAGNWELTKKFGGKRKPWHLCWCWRNRD